MKHSVVAVERANSILKYDARLSSADFGYNWANRRRELALIVWFRQEIYQSHVPLKPLGQASQ